jgi:hypothetical protein
MRAGTLNCRSSATGCGISKALDTTAQRLNPTSKSHASQPRFGLAAVLAKLARAWRAVTGSKPMKAPSPLDRTVDPQAVKDGLDKRQTRSLWWLTDAPMFFDEPSVQKLYDAIVAPEYVLLQSKEVAEKAKTESTTVGSETGGEFSVPTFFKINLKAKLDGSVAEAAKRSSEVTKQFLYSNQQRLQDLVVAYNEAFRERVLYQDTSQPELLSLAGPTSWANAEALLDQAGPRPLIFIDLKPGAPIIPTAGETCKGKVVRLYEALESEFNKKGPIVPPYPRDRDPTAEAARKAYWEALVATYDSKVALEVVEKGFEDGDRVDWIDYRLKLATREAPLHLHLAANGKFSTGTFAYNFVRRGHKFGLRLVGLLKSGGDINVLAIYER